MYCLYSFILVGDYVRNNLKSKYLSSTFLLLASTVVVKIISALYKIPLTEYIGATGRGYFNIAYNLSMPVYALTMGAFPIALTRLVSSYDARGDRLKVKALRLASKRLFFIVAVISLVFILAMAKPYSSNISASPNSIFTILAIAPSVFFSCLCAGHRAFAEGFLDMKATAISQTIEALFKLVFGLLFAKHSLEYLLNTYYSTQRVLGVIAFSKQQALSMIYPISSAFAMLGVTLGSMAGYIFAMIYTSQKYSDLPKERVDVKSAYNQLLSCSVGLVGATVVQSIANFFDTASIQFCLSRCDAQYLANVFSTTGDDVYTYVLGMYAVALDFKNLVPAIVMVLGVVAVPAVNSAYENNRERFSSLINSIFKYSVILSTLGGFCLSLFYNDLLCLFYSSSQDIISNAGRILFALGVTILPCCVATTTVYCVQGLGYAKSTIPPFILSAVVRVALNFALITNDEINIIGSAVSNMAGYLIIVVWNMVTIKKNTKIKINAVQVFVKPIVCGGIVFFVTNSFRQSFFNSTNSPLMLVLCGGFSLILYIFLLILMNCVTFSDLKTLK